MNPTNTPALETQRLILRKFTEDDLEDVYLIYSDREANAFLPWFPLETRDEAKAVPLPRPLSGKAHFGVVAAQAIGTGGGPFGRHVHARQELLLVGAAPCDRHVAAYRLDVAQDAGRIV